MTKAHSQTLVTVSRGAEMLGVSAKTLRRWIDDGLVPAYRVGGPGGRSIRVDREELVAALIRPLRDTESAVG